MSLRSALLIPVTTTLACVVAATAVAAPGRDPTQQSAPSLTTVPCPLMDPSTLLSGPADRDGGASITPGAVGGLLGAFSVSTHGMGSASRGKAILLTALAPGAGHLYSGYDRGYVYLGMEAVAWISYFVLRENGNGAADRAESFAGNPNDPLSTLSFDRYTQAGFCNEPRGSAADSSLHYVWANDRPTFYDLIESDPKYGCGWEDSETWGEFRNMRSNSDDFLRWARYAGAAVLLNHAMALIDMVRLTRDIDLPGGAEVMFKVDASPARPSGSIRIKKAF